MPQLEPDQPGLWRAARIGVAPALFLSLLLSPLPLRAFEIVGHPLAGVDQAPGVRVIEMPVTQSGTVVDIRFSVEAHGGSADDLTLFLVHPNGTFAVLYQGSGSEPSSSLQVEFSDAAAEPVPATGSAAGLFRPVTPLSIFDGLDLAGTWQLLVWDRFGLGDGTRVRSMALLGETTVTAIGTPANDVDVAPPGVTLPLPVSEIAGDVVDVNLSFELTPPCSDDVRISLSKDGISTILKPAAPGCVASTIAVTLDDEAAESYPVGGVGTFRPAPGSLAAFDTLPAAGTWDLTLVDETGSPGDGTDLVGWSVEITVAFIESFPDPLGPVDSGTASILDVKQTGTISDLALELRLSGPCPNDVEVVLSHLGIESTIKAALDPDCAFSGPIDARFDDEATDPFVASGVGTFLPGEPLDRWNGKPVEGIWELRFADSETPGDGTTLESWSLDGTLTAEITGPGRANADAGDVVVPLVVAQERVITDLDVSIEITGSCPGDIQGFLTHAGVTSHFLPADDPACFDSLPVRARFDDESEFAFSANDESVFPFSAGRLGTFKPSPDTLSVFDGLPLEGEWELRLVDTQFPGEGTALHSWTLHATHSCCAEVAGPAQSDIDVASPGVDIPLVAPVSGAIRDLDFAVEIDPEYADEVDVFLSHGGVEAHVYDAVGGNQDARIDARFDDEAADRYPERDSFTGSFMPAPDLLTVFDGMDFAGPWTLTLVDDIEPGDGTPLLGWSLVARLVPEPSFAAQAVAAVAAFGVIGSRRRRG